MAYMLLEACGAVLIMNSKMHLGKISFSKYFKAIYHYFRVYSLSGFNSRSMYALVFFFVSGAGFQVAVLAEVEFR